MQIYLVSISFTIKTFLIIFISLFLSMYLPALASLLAASCYGLTVGVISDMHTNLLYDATVDPADKCWSSGSSQAETPAAWARIGCDPSADLVDAMLQRMSETYGKPDVLLVTGDFVNHGISLHREDATA